jgi:phage terminase large subunit GpA-like protein
MPTPRTTPDAWAKKNRRYPPSSGVPGPRNPALTPYMIPWARAIAAGGGKYRRAVMCCASQMGKTDQLLDVIGSRLDTRPAPIMYVGPSRDFNTDQFEPRLMALFDQAPSLADKLARGQRNKKTKKLVAGVPIRLAHAGSSTSLKSDPAAIALVDEYDEMLRNVKGQGDPLGLVEARGFSFADFVVGVASTPSLGVGDVEKDPDSGLEFWKPAPPEDLQSPIWRLWQEGTRHHLAWPCPHCLEYFIPRFAHLKWQQAEGGEHKITPAEAKRTAYVECPRCGGVLTDAEKLELNASGRFVAPGQTVTPDGEVIGEPPDSSTLSFWVSGLASPFVTFGQRAEAYLAAVREGSQDKIQTAVNASFGELFSIGGGDAPQWAEVAQCRGEYGKGELPSGVRFLVMTVDVQKSRIFYVVRGWGARGTSWLVDYGALFGETIEEGVWTDLADLIATPVCGRPVQLVLIDSGFRPGKVDELPLNRIYDFCRRFPRLARPTKGSSMPMRVPLIKSSIEVTAKGATLKAGLTLLRLDPDYFKSRVFERIRWPQDQPGAWHLPHDVSEDFCRQIVSEARVRLASGRVKWVRRSKENHFLDLEAMQCAAAHLINAGRIPAEGVHRAPAPPPAQPRPSDVVPEEIDAATADESFREQPDRLGPYGQRHPAVPPAFDGQPSWLHPNGRRGSFWGR